MRDEVLKMAKSGRVAKSQVLSGTFFGDMQGFGVLVSQISDSFSTGRMCGITTTSGGKVHDERIAATPIYSDPHPVDLGVQHTCRQQCLAENYK